MDNPRLSIDIMSELLLRIDKFSKPGGEDYYIGYLDALLDLKKWIELQENKDGK